MAMALGIVLAVTTAILRQSSNPVLRWVALAYLWFFRGTPIYTQLVFWGALSALYQKLSLGIPFGPELLTFKTTTVFTPFVAAVLGLGINEGAYLSEIVRSGLNSVDKGQSEAAGALGMSRGQILRRIVLPQAMRGIVPPTGNETISMLKTTSLVLAVPFTLDLTFVTNSYASLTYQIIPLLLVAAIWYIIITSILMVGQHYIERYYGKGFDSDKSSGSSGRGPPAPRRPPPPRSAPPLASDPALEFAEASPLAPPLAFEESEPPEAEAEEFADAEPDAPLPAEELEEEPLELSEPQALSATMPATARDTYTGTFVVVIIRILSPDKYQLVF